MSIELNWCQICDFHLDDADFSSSSGLVRDPHVKRRHIKTLAASDVTCSLKQFQPTDETLPLGTPQGSRTSEEYYYHMASSQTLFACVEFEDSSLTLWLLLPKNHSIFSLPSISHQNFWSWFIWEVHTEHLLCASLGPANVKVHKIKGSISYMEAVL